MGERIIILTGERGIGKSTVCRETIALAQATGHTCGGLLTFYYNDELCVLDVHGGNACQLTAKPEDDLAVVQGRFRFDSKALTWGNGCLLNATPCDLLVIDEIGPLEIERGEGWTNAFNILHQSQFTLALVVVRPELVVHVQLQLPSSATTVISVTLEDRDQIPSILVDMLEQEMVS